MNKPRILIFNRVYLPGFRAGGPIRSIANLVDALGDEFDFSIVTRDRDTGAECPYSSAAPGEWVEVGKAKVLYLNDSEIAVRRIRSIFQEKSVHGVMLNSFFDPIFTQKVLFLRKLGLVKNLNILVAPRGEFSQAAMGLKMLKKRSYLAIARSTGLYKGLLWQASSEIERGLILEQGLAEKAQNVFVACNIGKAESPRLLSNSLPGRSKTLRIACLSRIVPMKNIDFALRVLREVKSRVEFSIYGPIEDTKYWEACQSLIAELPKNVSVVEKGPVVPDLVAETLQKHHLFFLPTRGENFGHVIHESLSAGVPVLISDRTPWNNVEESGAGWALPLEDPSRFSAVIERVCAMQPDEWDNMIKKARQLVDSVQRRDHALEENRRLLKLLVSPDQ